MFVLRNAFIILLFLGHYTLLSQYLDVTSGTNISGFHGDEINAQWSPDGKSVVFEAFNENKSSLYMYNFDEDTIIHIVSNNANFRNPVWHPDGQSIIAESNMQGMDYLFSINVTNYEIKPLFKRKIACKQPSYSTSDRQIYFTGYNEVENKWEIYSYDFIYDNLNEVSSERFDCSFPNISPDGKIVIYNHLDPFNNSSNVKLMNWYGETSTINTKLNTSDYQWHPEGLKFLFIIEDNGNKSQLYSIWKDGTHLEQITSTDLSITSPSVSPDGSKIAISVKGDTGFDVYVINFEDY